MNLMGRIQISSIILLRIGVVVLALVGVVLLYFSAGTRLNLSVGNVERSLFTHARTVGQALDQAGVQIGSFDQVSPPLDTPLQPGTTVRVDRSSKILLDIDGERSWFQTTETIPANILAFATVLIYPGDRLEVDSLEVSDPTLPLKVIPNSLKLRRASTIHLAMEGQTILIQSSAPTLGEALWDAGVKLQVGDHLNPAPETPLNGPMEANLYRARHVTIDVDDDIIQTMAAGPTVGNALASTGIALIGLDYSEPGIDKALPADGRLRVVRVQEKVIVEVEPLPFETVFEPSPDLEIDRQEIIDPGGYGLQARRQLIRVEDGEEVSRALDSEWVAVDPRPRKIGFGTKIIVRTLATPSGTLEYWRAVTMYATPYSPCNSAADRCYPITSSGKPVQKGVVAFILSWYRQMKGWPVYIPDYGVATVEDVGGGIPGRYWIDLGYSDDDIISWSKWVTVYFLTPVPPYDSIPWILE